MTDRVVLGALPGGGYGLRVSLPGFDVKNANLAPNQKAFDSEWTNTLKYHAIGSVFLPVNTGGSPPVVVSFPALSSPPPTLLFKTTTVGIKPIAGGNTGPVYPFGLSAFGGDALVYNNRIEFIRPHPSDGASTAYYIVLLPL